MYVQKLERIYNTYIKSFEYLKKIAQLVSFVGDFLQSPFPQNRYSILLLPGDCGG